MMVCVSYSLKHGGVVWGRMKLTTKLHFFRVHSSLLRPSTQPCLVAFCTHDALAYVGVVIGARKPSEWVLNDILILVLKWEPHKFAEYL